MGRLKEGVGEAMVVVAAVGRVLGGKWGGVTSLNSVGNS